MEVKKNLNNVQRKMLDEIYTEQFKKRERQIIDERNQGFGPVVEKALKEFAKDKDVKNMLEAGKKFYELQTKLDDKLRKSGVGVEYTLSGVPRLKNGYRYSNEYESLPAIQEYKNETARIEQRLAELKREMRAKIYGVSATYEEVDSEIKELLKGL